MSEYEHHAPRVINKSKKTRNGINEEANTKRQHRISFKNFIRQVEEQSVDTFSEDTWVVERGILLNEDDKFLTWNEIAAFADEQEALDESDRYRDIEEGNSVFRARQV